MDSSSIIIIHFVSLKVTDPVAGLALLIAGLHNNHLLRTLREKEKIQSKILITHHLEPIEFPLMTKLLQRNSAHLLVFQCRV